MVTNFCFLVSGIVIQDVAIHFFLCALSFVILR